MVVGHTLLEHQIEVAIVVPHSVSLRSSYPILSRTLGIGAAATAASFDATSAAATATATAADATAATIATSRKNGNRNRMMSRNKRN